MTNKSHKHTQICDTNMCTHKCVCVHMFASLIYNAMALPSNAMAFFMWTSKCR